MEKIGFLDMLFEKVGKYKIIYVLFEHRCIVRWYAKCRFL